MWTTELSFSITWRWKFCSSLLEVLYMYMNQENQRKERVNYNSVNRHTMKWVEKKIRQLWLHQTQNFQGFTPTTGIGHWITFPQLSLVVVLWEKQGRQKWLTQTKFSKYQSISSCYLHFFFTPRVNVTKHVPFHETRQIT